MPTPLFADSFDHYGTANIPAKYSSYSSTVSIVSGVGRCGTNCLQDVPTPGGLGVIRGIPTQAASVQMALASYFVPGGSTAAKRLLTIYNGITPTGALFRANDGSVYYLTNPDAAFPPLTFQSDGNYLPLSEWIQWSIGLSLDHSAGAIYLKRNGAQFQNATGISTIFSTDPIPVTGTQLYGSAFTSTLRADDYVIATYNASDPWNDLLGDVHVEYLRPFAAGDLTQWIAVGGLPNYQAVDDQSSPDGETTYVHAVNVGDTDLYQYQNVALTPGLQIFGVQMSGYTVKETAGNRLLAFLTKQGGTIYEFPSSVGLTTGVPNYAYQTVMASLNPATGLQWQPSEVNRPTQYGMRIAV